MLSGPPFEQLRRTISISLALGVRDVVDNYRRSVIGPFWISVATIVQMATLGFIFALIFGLDTSEYLPHLSIGLVVWSWISQTLQEAGDAVQKSQSILRQVPVSPFMPTLRLVIKNSLVFAHTLPVAVLVSLWFNGPSLDLLLLPVPLLLVAMNLSWMASVLVLLGAKYRDLPPLISAVLLVGFYATPVIWLPSQLPESVREPVLALNPFAHMVNAVRGPLDGVGEMTQPLLALLVLGTCGTFAAAFLYRKYSWRLQYWL